ncbi:MAG: CZB domain-containing protein [Leptospiraceae bacterium]|nr:CZB domain-containing protein [Leptospiraceae bacterium]
MKKNFILFSSYDKWFSSQGSKFLRDILRNEWESNSSNVAFQLISQANGVKNSIFKSADDISISILTYPDKLNKIETFQREFVKKIKNFSKLSQSLAASSEELHAVISQFSENVTGSISTVGVINQNSQSVTKNLEQMDIKITEIKQRSNNISKLNQETLDDIGIFSNVVTEVSSNVGLLKEISDQISFLALNASIEAAKAGDDGKGFSVVADGVSNLAEKSKHAVKLISDSIIKIKERFGSWRETSEKSIYGLKDIFNSIENVKELSNKSMDLATLTSDQIGAVSESFTEFQSIMDEIERTANFVADSSSEIIDVVSNIEDESSMIFENFVDINNGIQASFKMITNQNPIWLLHFIYARRMDHIKWVKDVDEAIKTSSPESFPQLDHTKCKMGLWYYLAEVADEEQKVIHKRMEEPHRNLHQMAAKIRDAVKRKDNPTISRYRIELGKIYDEIAIIFNEYIDLLEKQALNSDF